MADISLVLLDSSQPVVSLVYTVIAVRGQNGINEGWKGRERQVEREMGGERGMQQHRSNSNLNSDTAVAFLYIYILV